MKKTLPNIYLVGFSVLVMISLVVASFAFWEGCFQKSLYQKSVNLKSIITQRTQRKRLEELEINLSFNPKTDLFLVGKNSEIEVIIDSQGKEIWGADLKIIFNPVYLEVRKVSPGDYFQEPLELENLIRKEEGEIWFSAGSLSATRGKRTIVILEVKPLQKGEATFSFSLETQVALKGKEEPAIIKSGDLRFLVNK